MEDLLLLKFTFKYTPDLINEKEKNPILHFYLSSDVGHDIVSVNPIENRNIVDLSIKKAYLENDSTLNIFAFADTMNDTNELSTNEAGYNWIFLKDILHSSLKAKTFSRDLIVFNALHSIEGKNLSVNKGKIEIHVEKVKNLDEKEIENLFNKPTKFTISQKNGDFIQKILNEYRERSNEIFFKKQPTFESVKYLHFGAEIWQFGNWQVIGSCYAFPRAQNSPEQVWINLSRAAIRRHYKGLDLDDAIQKFMSSDEENVMTVVSKMHGIYANYATYISDGILAKKVQSHNNHTKNIKSNKFNIQLVNDKSYIISNKKNSDGNYKEADSTFEYVSMEAFSNNLRSRGNSKTGSSTSGDCEDLTSAMSLESMELKNRKDWTDPVLIKMHEVRQNYMFLQTLMGVRGAQLSDAAKKDKDSEHSELGGHMAGMYVSVEHFIQMHKRFNINEEPYIDLELNRIASNIKRSAIQTLEGTGLTDPLGSHDTSEYNSFYQDMQYLQEDSHASAFSRIKFISPLVRNQTNPFYRVIVSFNSPDLADKYASSEHVVLTKQKSGEITIGCDYLDFINEKSNIMTYSMPEFTENEISVNKQLLKHRFPIIPLQEPKNTTSYVQKCESKLKEIEKHCKAMNRSQDNTMMSPKTTILDFFPRHTQITDKLVEKWKNLISAKTRIFKFEYFEEPISENAHGYMLRLYLTK